MPKPIKVRRSAKSGKTKTPETTALPWPVIVLGAIAAVLLLLGVWLGPSMYRAVVRSGALNRIGSAVDAAVEKSDFAQAAKLVEPDLEYFAEFMVQENAPKRQQAMQGILPAIPSEKLPDSCFAIPNQSALFPTVVRIASSRPREWLIEKSSQANSELRGVAAEALATQLPSGTAPAAEIAKLAEPLAVEQKQMEFQRLYDEQHQQIEQTLVGEWTLQLHAEFVAADQSRAEDFELASRHFAVSCQQQQWTVKFFDQSWTGRLEEMRAVNLKASPKEVATALAQFPLRAALKSSPVELQLVFAPPQGFTVQATGFPKSRPDSAWNMAQSKGTTLRIQNQEINLRVPSTPAGARSSSFEIKESRDMPFGRIDIKASGSDGEVSFAEWRMKGEPGFSKFDLTALSPRQIAEANAANEKPAPAVQNDAKPMPDMPLAEQPPPAARVVPHGQWREWRASGNPLNDVLSLKEGERFGVIGLSTAKEGKPSQPVLKLWRTDDGTVVEENEAHPFVHGATFASSADGKRIVTAETLRPGREGIRIRVWDVDGNGKLSNPRPLEFPFRDVLVPASYDARQRLSLIGKNETNYAARAIAVSPTGRWATVANGQGAVCFYDLQDAKLVEQILLVIDREQGVVNEKYWSALSHQPVFLSDDEFVSGGYVFKTNDLRHYIVMRIPELMAQLSGGEIPFPKVIAMPGHRRLFALLGNELREVRVPVFPGPNAGAAAAPTPAPGASAARGAPQRPVPTKKTTKPAAPAKSMPEPLRIFSHENPITATAIAPDGTRLATSDEKGQLSLWSLTDGKLLKSASLDTVPIRRLEFASGGQRLVSTHASGTIRIWNLADLEDSSQGRFRLETVVPELPNGSQRRLHPLSDNKRLLIAGGRGLLFDIEKSEVTERDLILPMIWTLDLKFGLQSIGQARPELFDLKSQRELAMLWPKGKTTSEGGDETTSATFLPNGRTVAVARKGGKIETWKVPAGTLDTTNSDSQIVAESVVASADGATLFVQQRDDVVRRLEAKTLKELNRINKPASIANVARVAIGPDGSLCAICSHDRVIVVQSDTGQVVHDELNHAHAQFTPDGKRLVTASQNRIGNSGSALRIRNVADWSLVVETKAIPQVYSLAITPNGRWLFVVAPSGLLKAELPE